MATFTNQATLAYNGNTTTSNITTGELLEVLSATKTAVNPNYTDNDNTTFVISIINSGNTAFSGLTISDNLGAYTFDDATTLYPLTYIPSTVQYYVNGVLQTAPTVTAGPPLEFTNISVPANSNATIIYEANVNQFAPLAAGSTITNTATISGTGLTTDLTADATITAESAPSLTISKSMSPSTVTENGQLTYTFVIQNTGNTAATAADLVTVTDTFNPILNPITVTLDNTTWTAPDNYTYEATTGLFTSVPGQITVPAATYTQTATNGTWTVNPGVTVLTVTGTV